MKKIYAVLILIIITFTACSNKDISDKAENSTIYTSIYPISYITTNIVGDKFEVENIIPNDSDAHSWEPTPKDMANMEDAKLIFVNGLEMEGWLDSLSSVINMDKVYEVNKGIDLIKIDEGEKESHEGHEHGEFDPHIWLSIKNMKIIASNVYEKVVDLDKKNEGYYKENYDDLIKKLDNLDKEYSLELEKYSGKSIVVPHEAFGYLSKDYNLVQIPIEGLNSETEPDLGKVAEIVNLAKNKEVKGIFYEYNSSDKISKTIANEIGGQVLPLYTAETITEKQISEKKDYITMMQENLKNLIKSFEG